jgi:GTPase
MPKTACGYCAIVGIPNTGKSTLLNYILNVKISITSHKQQTTRHQIIGIKTQGLAQTIYIDTPGFNTRFDRAIQRETLQTLATADVICFMVDAKRWTQDDQTLLMRIKSCNLPTILVINKIDQLKDQKSLLPYIQTHAKAMDFAAVVPICARKGTHVAQLEKIIASFLPSGDFIYPKDHAATYLSDEFLSSEVIREKLMRQLHQEIPYQLNVEISSFIKESHLIRIEALIWIERSGQKGIVLGKGGERLKQIGTNARLALEKLFQCKVFLSLWVKVRDIDESTT